MATVDYDNMIEDVLMQFNFHKVLRVMEFLEWTWCGQKPTLGQLKEEAKDRLKSAVDSYKKQKTKTGFGYSSSGGFEAYAYERGVSLAFAAEEIDVEG